VIGFAGVVIILITSMGRSLPYTPAGAYLEAGSLRFAGVGCIFCVALGFGLRCSTRLLRTALGTSRLPHNDLEIRESTRKFAVSDRLQEIGISQQASGRGGTRDAR
jgi:hypothetical protein